MPFNNFSQGGNKVVPFYSGQCKNPANVVHGTTSPSNNNVESPTGTLYINTAGPTAYICTSNTGLNGAVTWEQIGVSTGTVATLEGDSGGQISPIGGNINLNGTSNQITTTGSGNNIVWSLSATLTVPGSLTTVGNLVDGGTLVVQGSGTSTIGSSNTATTINIANGTGGNTVSINNGVNTSTNTTNIANGAGSAANNVSILSGVASGGASSLLMGDNPY